MNENIIHQNYSITQKDRNKAFKHPSFVLWFTGLSGSGKSTIANALEVELFKENKKVYVLDGDNIRMGINKGLGFSLEDRNENLRRIAEVSKLFVDAGIIVLAAFISPTIKDRKMVEEIVGEDQFFEIFVDTDLETCEKRDVKGLYQKARKGEIKNFTGIDSPYEKPENPDVHIRTEKESVEDAVRKLINFVKNISL
ncbi:MAG: adenylyl-sulfate kinase [Brumimicrobium sp.]